MLPMQFGVALQDRFDLLLFVANAGQVRNRIELGGVLNALDQVVCQFARRTAGAICHADEVRHVVFELADRLIQTFRGRWCFRRKEFERKRRRFAFCMMSVMCMRWGDCRSD